MNITLCPQALIAIQQGIERGDPVVDLDLSQHILNALDENGIVTLEQLLDTPQQTLFAFENLGVKSINRLFDCLNKYHLIKAA